MIPEPLSVISESSWDSGRHDTSLERGEYPHLSKGKKADCKLSVSELDFDSWENPRMNP